MFFYQIRPMLIDTVESLSNEALKRQYHHDQQGMESEC